MQITDFEIILHGVEHEQYFQGCGTSFTRWDECSTGCGDSEAAALEDALEQMASIGHEIPQQTLDKYFAEFGKSSEVAQAMADGNYYYVSVRYKTERNAA